MSSKQVVIPEQVWQSALDDMPHSSAKHLMIRADEAVACITKEDIFSVFMSLMPDHRDRAEIEQLMEEFLRQGWVEHMMKITNQGINANIAAFLRRNEIPVEVKS